MGNEEMGKWEDGTLHFTQQTADVLFMRKSMSIYALTERSSLPDNCNKRSMQHHCIMVCKLHFGSLLAFLKFQYGICELFIFLTLYKESVRDFFMQSLALLWYISKSVDSM